MKTGAITSNRRVFVNKAGSIKSLDGVDQTGELNTLPPCTLLSVNHTTANGVAPVNKNIIYELGYSDVTGSFKCWTLQNLGSANQATSALDDTESASGWYWQFANKKGYRYITSRTPSTGWPNRTLTNTNWTTTEDPCRIELGTGWRLPTYAEWRSVAIAYTSQSASFDFELKLHAAGWLIQNSGILSERGVTAHYWSSSSVDANTARGWVIPSLGAAPTASTNDKDAGFSIRCIRD